VIQQHRVVAALGAAAAIALLASCAGTPAPPAEEQEKSMTIGVPAIPPTIDQAVYPGESARWAHIMYGEGLLEYIPLDTDATALQDPSQLQPALAESFEVEGDTISMTLREAESAAGNTLTADDVKWTFDRAIALKDSTGLFYLRTAGLDLENPVEVIDERTVEFHGELTPLALVAFIADQFAIIDSTLALEHATDDDPWATEWLTTNSAGFGPYAVSAFEPDTQLTLQRNENYWREAPAFEEVIMTPTTAQTAVQLLQSGTVDYLIGIPLLQYATLAADDSVQTYVGPALAQDVLKLNQNFAPFQDENVRHAMSLALNREALVEGPYQGVGKPAVSVISQTIPGIDDVGEFYEYDIEAAQELLADSDYPDGFSFTLAITQAEVSSVDVSGLAVALVSQLEPLGITVEVQTIANSADLRAAATAGQLEAWLRVENPAVADAAYLFNLIHVTGASSNFTGESDPRIDALVKEAAALEFGDERNELLTEAAALWNERMYDIPLVQVEKTYAFGPNVCGFGPSSYQQVRVQVLATC
jgi:peptide/nickel transport system substrate-binding protein